MWVLSWKKYALSKFATFVSVLGALMRYAGVMCLFSSLIPAALICIAIGIGLHFGAEAIAKNKAAKVIGKANTAKTANPVPNATKTTVTQPTPKPVQTNPVPSATAQPTAASDGKIKCGKCGAIVSTANKFCTECGNTLVTEVPKQKKCLRCGANVDNGSKFCTECGYEINT